MRYFIVLSFILLQITTAYSQDKEILTIEEIKKIVLVNNRDLILANEKMKSAEGSLIEARAGFLPKFTLSGAYNYISPVPSINMEIPISTTARISKEIETGANNNWLFQAALNHTLFDWGRTSESCSLTNTKLEVAQLDVDLIGIQKYYLMQCNYTIELFFLKRYLCKMRST